MGGETNLFIHKETLCTRTILATRLESTAEGCGHNLLWGKGVGQGPSKSAGAPSRRAVEFAGALSLPHGACL